MKYWMLMVLILAAAGLGGQCAKKQEFVFQPRPGLVMRCVMKGVTQTNYDGTPAAILNFDLRFEKTDTAKVYFLFDSLRVTCNGATSTRTSCRTASLGVVSQREEVSVGECLYPLFAVFPETARLKPVESLDLVRNGLFNEQYETFIRRQ